MPTEFSSSIKKLTLIMLSPLLVYCGGASDVGNQSDENPIATAEVFGASQATSGEIEVRSGKDVLLSGFNSEGVDDPLLAFSWQQVDIADYTVDLYERTRNSVVFTAPEVPLTDEDGVLLSFELNVIDGDGKSANDTISVRVKPAYDANRFLLNPSVDERFVLIVAPNEGAALASDIPFTVNLSTEAHWQDRFGGNHVMPLSSENMTGVVQAREPIATTDSKNTFFKLPVPLLDADDINLNFQGEDRSSRLEFEHVKDARIFLNLSLSQQSNGPITIYLARESATGFELVDTSTVTTDDGSLNFSDEWLRQNLLVESRRSADNYYQCIDPNGEAETLTEWIEYAGFNAYPESIVHTSYVNNYDLNFGRDMYIRQDENGNVYSYVTNYPSLENIFSGRNEFAIVVMEYSPAPTGNCGDGTFEDDVSGKKIVKFYSYVPDAVTGEYVRAGSMNFDGRGERMVPGVCVACHYGDTNADQFNVANLGDISASAADLDSSFIPWDLDAFLYTGGENVGFIDPVYSSAEISAEITATYSRESQEENFRQQNQMVLQTFTHDIDNLKRFEIPIKLLHGWYGNSDAIENLDFGTAETPLSEDALITLQQTVSTLPANTFNGDYVQSGWESQPELYHKVFARNCRLCHAQISKTTLNFDNYEEFINNERLIALVFEEGAMPLSRLTMDRFWIDFYDETAPAEILRNHLNSDNNPNNDVPVGLLPGYPVARVTPATNTALAADVLLDFDGSTNFDGSDSLFSNGYEWNLNGEFVSNQKNYRYVAGDPGTSAELTFLTFNTTDALASRIETRSIRVNDYTPQADGLPSPTVNEGATVNVDIFEGLCPGNSPDSPACREIFGDIRAGEVPTIELGEETRNGNVTLVDENNGIIAFESTASSLFGEGEFSFTLTDSFGDSSNTATVSVTVNSLDGPEIAGPDTCTVDAFNYQTESTFPLAFGNSPCLNPAANDTAGEGLSLSLISVGNPIAAQGTVSVDNLGVISYTPRRFFVGQDSFSYTVQDSSLSQRTNSGTVVVDINATQSFSALASGEGVFARSGSTGCGDCHAGNLSNAPSWLDVDNVILAATNTDSRPYEDAELTLAEPTTREQLLTSILFQNACNALGSHTGGNRLCVTEGSPSSITDLNEDGLAILRWLEEGAQNN